MRFFLLLTFSVVAILAIREYDQKAKTLNSPADAAEYSDAEAKSTINVEMDDIVLEPDESVSQNSTRLYDWGPGSAPNIQLPSPVPAPSPNPNFELEQGMLSSQNDSLSPKISAQGGEAPSPPEAQISSLSEGAVLPRQDDSAGLHSSTQDTFAQERMHVQPSQEEPRDEPEQTEGTVGTSIVSGRNYSVATDSVLLGEAGKTPPSTNRWGGQANADVAGTQQTGYASGQRAALRTGQDAYAKKFDTVKGAARADPWDKNGIPLDETNVAGMNSDEAKAVRHEAAKGEPNWAGVGEKVGLWRWRVQNRQGGVVEHEGVKTKAGFGIVKDMNPTDPMRFKAESDGDFYEGDSYIVLDVKKDPKGSAKLIRNIFFWIGKDSTIDEYGTAAYKAVELCDYFKGEYEAQHRETQAHESDAFKALFKAVKYLEGEKSKTGFTAHPAVIYKKTLYMVRKLSSKVSGSKRTRTESCPAPMPARFQQTDWYKREGKKWWCVMELKPEAASLNKGDCFMLESKRITGWCGPSGQSSEKYAVRQIMVQVNRARPGKLQRDPDILEKTSAFIKELGVGQEQDIQDVIKSIDAVPDETQLYGEGILYHIWSGETKKRSEIDAMNDADAQAEAQSDGVLYAGQMKLNIKEVARGDLKTKQLVDNDVMMVDTGKELLVWVGRGADDTEERGAMGTCLEYALNNPILDPMTGERSQAACTILYDSRRPGKKVITNPTWMSIFSN